MRTNSFIKLINTELKRELRKNGLDPNQVNQKDLQIYIDKMKNRIEEFVEEQVKLNTIAIYKCKCRHSRKEHYGHCGSCDCDRFRPKNRSSILLFLVDEMDEDEVLYSA